MIGLLLVCGQTVGRRDIRDVTGPCGFARPWWKVRVRGAVPRNMPAETRRIAGERDYWRYRVIRIASSVWADRVVNYVRDVAVPCGFARPGWEVFAWRQWGARNRLA